MEAYFANIISSFASPQSFGGIALISLISVWSIIWKIIALWKSARSNDRGWFLVVLLVNLAGIIEIVYLFYFAKDKLTIDKIKSNIKTYKFQNPWQSK